MAKMKLIEDGFLLPFKAEIGPVEIAGTFRPATPAEVDAHFAAVSRAKPGAEKAKLRAEFLAEKVRAWDVEDAAGHPVPPAAENFLKPAMAAFVDAIESRVCGYYMTEGAAVREGKS